MRHRVFMRISFGNVGKKTEAQESKLTRWERAAREILKNGPQVELHQIGGNTLTLNCERVRPEDVIHYPAFPNQSR